MMETLLQDLRYAVRQLRKSPLFTLVAVLSLGLGIGLDTALFSLVNATILRPLPVAAPARVVGLFVAFPGDHPIGRHSILDYEDLRDRARSFEALAAFEPREVGVLLGDRPEVARAEVVSGNYFDLVGGRPTAGRFFHPDDDRAGAAPAVVLGERFWRQRFGGDPSIVGGVVRIAGQPFTVIGIGPQGYAGMRRMFGVDLWLPIHAVGMLGGGGGVERDRNARWLQVYGRLRPGVTFAAAQAEAARLAAGLRAASPDGWTDERGRARELRLYPEPQIRFGNPVAARISRATAALVMGLASLVLVIACANLANLLLARAAARRRELAVRLALGARRGRLVRQLLTESLLLGMLGAGVGLLFAVWAVDAVVALPLGERLGMSVTLQVPLDGHVLVFTLAIALLTGLALGLAPALRASRPDLVPALRDESSSPGRSRLAAALVVAQVAASLVLLVVGGLFVRSLGNASRVDPGFTTREGLVLSVDPTVAGYDSTRAQLFAERLLERVRTTPGVDAATLTAILPLQGDRMSWMVQVPGVAGSGERAAVSGAMVGPDFFTTMGLPLVRGRGITAADRAGAPSAVVVSEAFVRRYFRGSDPIGRQLAVAGGRALTIVGVARDAHYVDLDGPPEPFFYTALLQEPNWPTGLNVVVRTRGAPAALVRPLEAQVRALDPAVPVTRTRTLSTALAASLLPAQVGGYLLGSFGLFGLLLAALGLYGVMAYTVAQRTREIGVRMALGARGADVLALVVGRGLRLTLIGVGIGLAVSLALGRVVGRMLYGLSPTDPVTLVAVVALLLAVATLASWLPARRAARVDPLIALRTE